MRPLTRVFRQPQGHTAVLQKAVLTNVRMAYELQPASLPRTIGQAWEGTMVQCSRTDSIGHLIKHKN
jgi:hypothetical protein